MENEDLEKAQKLNQKKKEMLNYQGEDRYASFEEHKKLSAEKPTGKNITTNITALEKITNGGFLLGKLWVVSATTGTGKTTFLRTIHHHFSEKNINGLWLSYEEGIDELIDKFPKIPKGGAPLQHIGRNLEWIENKIIEAGLKDNCEVIFIDHLHYLIPLGMNNTNYSTLIGGVMRELHEMAKRNQVLIFLVAHTAMIKAERTPTLADIRDSSFIGQEADGIIILYREQEKGIMKNTTTVSIQKNRKRGATLGSFQMSFANDILWEIADTRSSEPLPDF